MNNIIEQDHRFIRKRIVASLGFRSAEAVSRTIEGYEAMHAIRKGQIRWLAKGDVVGRKVHQRSFRCCCIAPSRPTTSLTFTRLPLFATEPSILCQPQPATGRGS